MSLLPHSVMVSELQPSRDYEIFMYGLFLTLLFPLFKKSTDLRCSN